MNYLVLGLSLAIICSHTVFGIRYKLKIGKRNMGEVTASCDRPLLTRAPIKILTVVGGCSNSQMTRQQIKNTGKLMKKSCIPKNDVTEEQVGSIEQGKFIEERNVMCYIACVYTMTGVVKNNKLNHEAMIKQIDIMFPPEMKEDVKATVENCKDVSKKYKDICEVSYWTAKCMFDTDSKNFVFP